MIRQTLENGLTILVEERLDSPVVAIVTYVKTGYFDESDKMAGISHVMEHMFFKGTHRRPDPEAIAQETKALGGVLNAGTGYESTSYYVVAPAESFEQALDIQYDALTDPLLDPDELQRETEVVIQEARQKLDNPWALSVEKMFELAFDRHRIRRWRIGYPDDLRAITRDDILNYYRDRYAPQNIVLCIVGGVESGLALQVAERMYGGIAKRPLTEDPSPREPEQVGLKFQRLTRDIKQKLVHVGFHAPSIVEADYYPLSVATDLLGDGRSSRLHQSLMERRQIVSTTSAYYSAYRDAGIVTISAEVLVDDPREVVAAIFEEIEKLKREPVHHDELEKIKTMIESDFCFEQEQVLGRANRLSYFEALGDYEMSDEFVDRLHAVTADDVARVAAKYLTPARATVFECVPNDAELPTYDNASVATSVSQAIEPLASASRPVVAASDGMRRTVLPSGAVLITKSEPGSPVTGVTVYFKGGRLCERREVAGITELALRSSLKGTAKYSGEELARRIESLGTSIGTNNNSDYVGYSLRILSKHLEEGFDLLSDIIAAPSFPDEEVNKEKDALRADIRRVEDSSFAYATDLLAEVAFPGHPYAIPDHGTEATVTALTRDQVEEWHRALASPEVAVVSVVGDFNENALTKEVESLFERLGPRSPLCTAPPAVFPQEVRERAVDRDREQTATAMGFPGAATDDPRRYVLDVTAALTSGLGGRLFAEVRGRQGLAYVVSSSSHTAAGGGMFVIYTATSPENEEKAREAIFAELQKLREEPAEVDEVERAKSYLRGARLISLQTAGARSRELAVNEIYCRGLNGTEEYLRGIGMVTPEDILNASVANLTPTRYCLGAVRGRTR